MATVSDLISAYNNNQKTLKEIMDEFNTPVDYPLFGKTYSISAQRHVYHMIRMKYKAHASTARNRFIGNLSKFQDLDDLIEYAPAALLDAVEASLNEVASDAVSVGLYSMDSKTIISRAEEKGLLKSFKNIYQAIVEKDEEIRSTVSSNATYRQIRKNTRGRWTSTTYNGTMLDAWGNQFKASTMNAIEGAGHSIRNAIGNAIDEANAEEARKKLFNNENNRKKLANCAYYLAFDLHRIVIEDISQKCSLNLGGWVTVKDDKEASAIYSNLQKLNLPLDQKKELLLKILNLNPYEPNYYKMALTLFLESGNEILAVANFFQIENLMDEISDILAEFVSHNIGNSADDLSECRNHLYKYAASLNLDSQYLQKALQLIEEKGSEILTQAATTQIGHSEEDALHCKEIIGELKQKMQLQDSSAEKAFGIINARLAQIDLEKRTVNGVVLTTREKAAQARNDVEQYKGILNNTGPFKTRGEFLSQIESIKQLPIATEISSHHIQIISQGLRSFDDQCKKAARHQYYLQNKNIFWNGDTNDMAIRYIVLLALIAFTLYRYKTTMDKDMIIGGSALIIGFCVYSFIIKPKKEMKIWEELTNKGSIPFQTVISDTMTVRNNSTVCPNCGSANHPQAAFCKSCGQKLHGD